MDHRLEDMDVRAKATDERLKTMDERAIKTEGWLISLETKMKYSIVLQIGIFLTALGIAFR